MEYIRTVSPHLTHMLRIPVPGQHSGPRFGGIRRLMHHRLPEITDRRIDSTGGQIALADTQAFDTNANARTNKRRNTNPDVTYHFFHAVNEPTSWTNVRIAKQLIESNFRAHLQDAPQRSPTRKIQLRRRHANNSATSPLAAESVPLESTRKDLPPSCSSFLKHLNSHPTRSSTR